MVRPKHPQRVLQDRRGRSRISQEGDDIFLTGDFVPETACLAVKPLERRQVASKSIRVSAVEARAASKRERNSVSRCSPTH